MATLLNSGLNSQQVFCSIKDQASSNKKLEKACANALAEIEHGSSLIDVLKNYQFFNRYQLILLEIGELSGKLPMLLMSIANQMQQKQERNQQLKTKLKLSQLVIVIGLVAGLILSAIKGGSFLPQLLGLIIIFVMTRIIYKMIEMDSAYLLSMLWNRPIIKNIRLFKRLFEYYFYELMVVQLEAGVDTAQAFKRLQNIFTSLALRRSLHLCETKLVKGESLLLALSKSELILTHEIRQVFNIGEKSGRLVEYLRHHLTLEENRLSVIVDAIYEWLPRFYYLIALSVVLHFMI